jgi:hypothetical protein
MSHNVSMTQWYHMHKTDVDEVIASITTFLGYIANTHVRIFLQTAFERNLIAYLYHHSSTKRKQRYTLSRV